MTPLVLTVGFLGSGKTTFLKNLLPRLAALGIEPGVVINDYQNAGVDAAQLRELTGTVEAISGDCVCCGSKDELLETLRKFEHRPGRVVIVDDVITAGTAIRESVEIIRAAGATPAGVALALDRQERGQGTLSAVQEVSAEFGLRCVSILTLSDLIETFAQGPGDAVRISREQFVALQAYQRDWGTGAVSAGAKAGAE